MCATGSASVLSIKTWCESKEKTLAEPVAHKKHRTTSSTIPVAMLKIAAKMLALAPAWLAVPLVIWCVDPHGLLRRHPADRERAERVAQGHDIVWPDAANYRGFVAELIPRMPRCDVVVLGSSRVFRLHAEPFRPRSLMNLGITCATFEELRGIVALLRREGKLPEHLIVGVDPWTLNPNHLRRSPDRALRAAGAIAPIPLRQEAMRTTFIVISPAYFQLSLRSAAGIGETASDSGYRRLADGSFVVPELRGTPGATPEERGDVRVQEAIRDRIWTEYSFLSGEEPLQEAFAEMLSGVPRVSILLVPLHPDFYRHVQRDAGCRHALEMEAWYRSFAAEHHIAVVGSFDPDRCGMDRRDFVDAHHCHEAAMARLAEMLAAP